MSASQPERVKIQEIIERLKSDPGFRREVANNPQGVLQNAGLQPDEVTDIAGGFGRRPEGGAQRYCQWTCIKETSECTKSYLV